MSSIVALCGRLTVFEIAPEMNGCVAAIMSMWPVWEIARSPTATSKTGRCSSLRPGGADDRVLLGDVGVDLVDLGLRVAHRLAAPAAPSWLTIVICPPPTSSLNLTSEKSGSIPVVSQSIRKLIVPVGASTVACALR